MRQRKVAYNPRWPPEDKKRLTFLWSELDMPGLVKAFPNRTEGGIRRQASVLGLSGLAPQGLESIKASALRTGYCKESRTRNAERFRALGNAAKGLAPHERKKGYVRRPVRKKSVARDDASV